MIYAILIGLVVGVVAKLVMPGRDPGGLVLTALLGISGSLLAAYFGQAVGWYRFGQPAGFVGSVIGALMLLVLYRLATGRRV
jgi:uncharacterized membrane protein YeaQ/YmgE (transglycosylase-associated protein family)